jgi:hypothetical protein
MKLNNLGLNNKDILYRYIAGSTLYGLNIPGISDIDIRGVYLADIKDVIDLGFNYKDQVSDEKSDVVYYEINKFLRLLLKSNPNVLESLYIPKDKIIGDIHPLIREIINNKDEFLTKECFNSFCGYAITQIQKARGLNKKVFIEKMPYKTPLDFCFTTKNGESIKIEEFLKAYHMEQNKCGLSTMPNMHYIYALYYDNKNYGYRGIIGKNSNEIRLTSIPKGELPVCYMFFNKDGYSKYCKDYKEFKEWGKNRNPNRFYATIKAGKGYDQKNIMHSIRMLHMGIEIANGEGFNVVRTWDKNFLMKIRNGEFEYDYIIEYLDNKKIELDNAILDCKLKENVNIDLLNNILIDIRKKQFYTL